MNIISYEYDGKKYFYGVSTGKQCTKSSLSYEETELALDELEEAEHLPAYERMVAAWKEKPLHAARE